MILRKPKLPTDTGDIIWSRVPEFALYWNGASAVIPYVEFYLNNVMHEVRAVVVDVNPALADELSQFIAKDRSPEILFRTWSNSPS